jgi:hypothetical protein
MKTNPSLKVFKLPTLAPLGIAIAAALSLAHPAKAVDIITTFDVSGTFTFPSSGTFSGMLVVDVTTGTVSSADITFPGLADLNQINLSTSFLGGWTLNLSNSTLDSIILDFTTTNPSSLVGFNGGTIFGLSVESGPPNFQTLFNGLSGTIAPPTVPDTGSTLGLLSLSVVALLGVTRLRFLQLAA